jgi:hypothetical protein
MWFLDGAADPESTEERNYFWTQRGKLIWMHVEEELQRCVSDQA